MTEIKLIAKNLIWVCGYSEHTVVALKIWHFLKPLVHVQIKTCRIRVGEILFTCDKTNVCMKDQEEGMYIKNSAWLCQIILEKIQASLCYEQVPCETLHLVPKHNLNKLWNSPCSLSSTLSQHYFSWILFSTQAGFFHHWNTLVQQFGNYCCMLHWYCW